MDIIDMFVKEVSGFLNEYSLYLILEQLYKGCLFCNKCDTEMIPYLGIITSGDYLIDPVKYSDLCQHLFKRVICVKCDFRSLCDEKYHECKLYIELICRKCKI